jgi:hypothetical protein
MTNNELSAAGFSTVDVARGTYVLAEILDNAPTWKTLEWGPDAGLERCTWLKQAGAPGGLFVEELDLRDKNLRGVCVWQTSTDR